MADDQPTSSHEVTFGAFTFGTAAANDDSASDKSSDGHQSDSDVANQESSPGPRTVSGETLGKVDDIVAVPKAAEEEEWLRQQLENHYLCSHLE
eukprot:gene3641-4073_t